MSRDCLSVSLPRVFLIPPTASPRSEQRCGRGAGSRRRITGTGLSLLLLAASLLACSGQRPPMGGGERPPEISPQERALRQCRERRSTLLGQLRELRRAELSLARLRSAPMPPTPGRPIWDEEKESRFSQEDQELDRQTYQRDLARWQERDSARWSAWQQRQTPEIVESQNGLNRLSRQLHGTYPQLFTAPGSIEIRPQELARLSRCEASGH